MPGLQVVQVSLLNQEDGAFTRFLTLFVSEIVASVLPKITVG